MTPSPGTGRGAAQRAVTITVRLERHRPDLPVYALVPAAAADAFGASGTFVVAAEANGTGIGRRSIKPWGDGRWFIELTVRHCAMIGAGEGDSISLTLRPAPVEPPELTAAIREAGLAAAWAALTDARRRSLGEPVFAAGRESTRARRIRAVVDRLGRRR